MVTMKKIANIAAWILTGITCLLIVFFAIPLLPIPNNYKVVIVRSGSMEPTIHTGSIVVYKPQSEYKKEDVVAFRNASTGPEKIVTIHRVMDVEQKDQKPFFKTKGDANKVEDAVLTPKEDVLGRVLFSMPGIGYLISWGQSPTGFVVMLVLPVTLLVYHEIHNFMNKRKDKKAKHSAQNEDHKAEHENS